jgi:DNA-nicking Smr family endonuclease
MKPKRGATYRPFENLKKRLKESSVSLEPRELKRRPCAMEKQNKQEDEQLLFMDAMEGVEPMIHEHIVFEQDLPSAKPLKGDPEADVLYRLQELVRSGDGFKVCHTSEYMEGIGYGVNPAIARRLHRGDFSVQSHLDLHGLVVDEARVAFEGFLKDAVDRKIRVVLIIHGRGLSSQDRPVLKKKVKKWLTTGKWRKWVLAFTSARPCDGGAGATYVLLRQRPATKRYRKQHGVFQP